MRARFLTYLCEGVILRYTSVRACFLTYLCEGVISDIPLWGRDFWHTSVREGFLTYISHRCLAPWSGGLKRWPSACMLGVVLCKTRLHRKSRSPYPETYWFTVAHNKAIQYKVIQYNAGLYSTVSHKAKYRVTHTIQGYTIQCRVIQYNTVSRNTIQGHTIQYNTGSHNTIQCHAIQYRVTQYSTGSHNTIQCHTIQYNTGSHNTIQCHTIQYRLHNTIQCHTIQYNTIQYRVTQYNTVSHNTIQVTQYNTGSHNRIGNETIQHGSVTNVQYREWKLWKVGYRYRQDWAFLRYGLSSWVDETSMKIQTWYFNLVKLTRWSCLWFRALFL